MTDSDVVDLNPAEEDTNGRYEYRGGFTWIVGFLVFGVYNFVSVVILLNMLIAMMTRTFDIIQVEWWIYS